jgi:hypothetical protein
MTNTKDYPSKIGNLVFMETQNLVFCGTIPLIGSVEEINGGLRERRKQIYFGLSNGLIKTLDSSSVMIRT